MPSSVFLNPQMGVSSSGAAVAIGTTTFVSGADVTVKTDGLRDNSGTLEFKNATDAWTPVASAQQLYDDFTRADTAEGSIGTAASGYVWSLLNSTGGASTVTHIASNIWVCAAGQTAYAWYQSPSPIKSVGGVFSFVAGGGANDSAVNLSISNAKTIAKLLHVTLTTTAIQVAIYVNSPYSNTVLLQQSISAPSDGSQHSLEYSITGCMMRLVVDGVPYLVNDSRIAEWANAKYTFWELAADANPLTLGRWHMAYASTSVGAAWPTTMSAGAGNATTVSNAPVTVAKDAAVRFGGSGSGGTVTVFSLNDNVTGVYGLAGTANATTEFHDYGTAFTPTKDSAGNFNIYYDAAGADGAGYYVQNKQSGSRQLIIVVVGRRIA